MPPFLEANAIRKHFPGVQALDGVSLRVNAGEVLAVVGENGAGKSTLMKILAGVVGPDSGELRIEGQITRLHGVADATRRGVVLIHQELNLASNLTVAANLFLGREITLGGFLGWLDHGQMHRICRQLLQKVGLQVSPTALVGRLAPGQQQLVEIARALSLAARLIIMDEPTSSLTQRETDTLYQVIDDLRASGVAIVYISHRLAEVKRAADRVTVLRDGRNAGDLAKEEINHDALVRLMVGRDLRQFYPRRQVIAADAPKRLTLDGVTYAGGPGVPISLTVRAGEIVGLAGLVGAGRTELAESLFGLRRRTGGSVLLDGVPARLRRTAQAVAQGLLLVPENRRQHGLIVTETVRDNLCLPNLDRLSTGGLVSPWAEDRLAREQMHALGVKAHGPGQIVSTLSGGNQQKVVLGKWTVRRPRVLILDEPTRGVDVGARSEIYALMNNLAAEGTAILMISSDLEEVLGMSDRVAVMHEGRLAGILTRAELSEEAIMHLATGSRR